MTIPRELLTNLLENQNVTQREELYNDVVVIVIVVAVDVDVVTELNLNTKSGFGCMFDVRFAFVL